MAITIASPMEVCSLATFLVVILSPYAVRNHKFYLTTLCLVGLSLSAFSTAQAHPQFQMPNMETRPPHGFSSQMITENLADDNTHFLVFDHVGQMAATTTYLHIMLSLNFSAVSEQIVNLNTSMYKFWHAKHYYKAHNWYVEEAMIAQTDRNLKQLSNRLQKLLDIIDNLNDILPEVHQTFNTHDRQTDSVLPAPPPNSETAFLQINHPHLKRHKRFVIALILGVVGTLWGLYSAYQIHQIASHLQDVSETQNLLVHLTQEDSKAINSLSVWLSGTSKSLMSFAHINPQIIYIHFSEKVLELEQSVTKLVNIVQQLQHRRLSVDWLSKESLQGLHKSVNDYTKKNNLLPLTTHTSDFFQLELSYIRTPEGVFAILHVPCTSSESILTIYKYIPFPIPLPHQTNHSSLTVAQAVHPLQTAPNPPTNDAMNKSEALYLVAESEMVAIDAYNKYKLLSQSDLAACIQKNHIYLCDKLQVLKTNLAETCIGSLFMKNKGGVRQNCKFEKRPLREEVFPLMANQFLVFTPEPFITQARCTNGTTFRAEFSKGTKLTVPNGCSINLKSHQISMADVIYIPSPPFVTAWKWDPLTLPSDLLADFPHLYAAIDNITSHLNNQSSSNLQNQSLIQDQLATSLLKIDSLSKSIDKQQMKAKIADEGFLAYLDNNLLFSGSTSSIMLWTVVVIVVVLLMVLAFFFYRQKITHKLVKSYDQAVHFRQFPTAPPLYVNNPLTNIPQLYPLPN